MRTITQADADFVAAREGERLEAYPDSGGVWTIGIGHTPAHKGQTETHAQALADLQSDLQESRRRLYAHTKPGVIDGLTPEEFRALLSWAYNVPDKPWTLYAKLNAGLSDAVPVELAKFVYAGGKPVPGLANRRNAEIAMWNSGLPAGPTVETLVAEPPPVEKKPFDVASLTAKVVTVTGATAAAVAQTADQVNGIVAPHVQASHVLAHVAEGLTLTVVAAGVVGLFVHKLQDNRTKALA